MASSRVWIIMNVSLGLIAVILLLTFWGITIPNIGQVLSTVDPEEPLCIVQVEEEHSRWDDLPRCCLEAQAQLECVREQQQFPEGETDFSCRSSSQVQYQLNTKAFRYCQRQVFWGK